MTSTIAPITMYTVPKGLRGAVGVGTWITQAEYKDLKVTQGDKTIFTSDFAGGTKGWKLRHGDWKVQEGALRQSAKVEDCRAIVGDANWTDYTFSVKARKLDGAEGFLILFHAENDGNFIWWNLGGWSNSHSAIERCRDGHKYPLGQPAPVKIETNRWYDVRIEVAGKAIRCFLDGKLVTEAEDSAQTVSPIYATASRELESGEVILKVVNASNGEQSLPVELQGAKDVSSSATAIVLTGQREDENSLDEPTKVAPVKRKVEQTGAKFTHTFPANSLTILRIKAGK